VELRMENKVIAMVKGLISVLALIISIQVFWLV
jgi:hypothetical protein